MRCKGLQDQLSRSDPAGSLPLVARGILVSPVTFVACLLIKKRISILNIFKTSVKSAIQVVRLTDRTATCSLKLHKIL